MYDIIITILLTLILLSLVIFFIVLSNSSKIGKIEKNKVHFYVTRDKDGKLWLYLNKPIRYENVWVQCKHGFIICVDKVFKNIGLNESDYKDLKWEDEPVEVFLNLDE